MESFSIVCYYSTSNYMSIIVSSLSKSRPYFGNQVIFRSCLYMLWVLFIVFPLKLKYQTKMNRHSNAKIFEILQEKRKSDNHTTIWSNTIKRKRNKIKRKKKERRIQPKINPKNLEHISNATIISNRKWAPQFPTKKKKNDS